MSKGKEVAVAEEVRSGLPAFAQKGKTSVLGNIDQSDLIIPRIKLLHGINPEVEQFEAAKAGNFWHTMLDENLGDRLPLIPITIRKTFTLWAPRGDDRGILARANDGINWDKKEKFEIKPKGSKTNVTWDTSAGTVAGSGLGKFGTYNPADPEGPPAAALTYNILAFFPDRPELGLALILNTRSAVKPAKNLVSKIEMRPVDHFGQRFVMGVKKELKDGDTFYNYAYTSDGYATEEQYQLCKGLYEKYGTAEFRANDESDDGSVGDVGEGNSNIASKF